MHVNKESFSFWMSA